MQTLQRFSIPALVLAGILFQLAIYWPSLAPYLDNSEHIWERTPLLTTPDAYLYLRHAADQLAGTFAPVDILRPYAQVTNLPLISSLAAHIAQLTGIDLTTVAFYLPPILASFMAFVCVGIGAAYGSKRIGFLTLCFSATTPMWFYRTFPGNFDTDGLNQVLFWAGLILGYAMLRGTPVKRAAVFIIWLTNGLLLITWWPKAGIPFISLNAGFIALGFIFEHRLYRKKSIVIGGLALLTAGGVCILEPDYLPSNIRPIFLKINQHLELILGDSSSLFLSTGNSIGELGNLTLSSAILESSGSVLLFLLASIGALHSLVRSRQSLYFIPAGIFFFLVSMLLGNRFLMFAAPALGIGMAWLLVRALPTVARCTTNTFSVLMVSLTVILIIYASQPAIHYEISILNDSYAAGLLQTYKKRSPDDAKTWNWWGPGYFIQYFAERETFIDGGSQTDQRTYTAAVPYASTSPLLSKNWIKFFSAHPNGLDIISRHLGSKAKATEFLLAALRQPYQLNTLMAQFEAPQSIDWKSFLYPEATAYFVAFHRMLYRGTWLPIGRWTPSQTTEYETTTLAYRSAHIEREKGTIELPDGDVLKYSGLYFVSPKKLSHDPVRAEGPVVILMEGVPYAFVIPQKYFSALAFKLLFISPDKIPGFTPIGYHPYVGGVWKVE